MAADHHHLVGQAAAADFADDVVFGLGLAGQAGVDVQPHGHRLAAAKDVRQQVGVRIGQGRRRNPGRALGIALHARVRKTIGVGADGTYDQRHRALAGRIGSTAARDHGGTVATAVLRPRHAVGYVGDLAGQRAGRRCLEGIERRELDHFRIERLRAGADAAAQRGDRQLLRKGRQHLRCLVISFPDRECHRLEVDLVVAERLEFFLGPDDGAIEGRRAGHSWPDFAGQRFQDCIGLAALVGGQRQLLRIFDRVLVETGGAVGLGIEREQAKRQEERGATRDRHAAISIKKRRSSRRPGWSWRRLSAISARRESRSAERLRRLGPRVRPAAPRACAWR